MIRAGLISLALLQAAPLPEGNPFVRGLVDKQRQREELLNRYTYDVVETREELDARGGVRKTSSRRFEVYHVKGRQVRCLVAEDGRGLDPRRRAREERKAREQAEAIARGDVARERPGVRLSQILERYDFRSVAREEVDGRAAIVLDFAPRPGARAPEHDGVLRRLAGRLWVDEAEREVVRVRVHNTGTLKFALGVGAAVSSLELEMDFRKVQDEVWLPRRVATEARGRKLLVRGFRTRSSVSFEGYRRFDVEASEQIQPPT